MARFNLDTLFTVGTPQPGFGTGAGAGFGALRAALEALPDALERKVFTQALRAAGRQYMQWAAARIPTSQDPRDPHPGWWRSTLRLQPMKRRKGRVGVVIQPGTRAQLAPFLTTGRRARALAGSRVGLERGVLRHYQRLNRYYYPAHAEFGHASAYGTRKVKPQPYMGRTLREGRDAILGVIRAEVDRRLDATLLRRGGI